MLTSVYPAGLQRGTTAELTVTGTNNFAGAYDVLFEGKGLTAKLEPPKEPEAPAKPPAPGKKAPKAEINTVTFKVTAAADAELGMREFRVLTPRGASSLGVLVVGDEPEQSEKEPNDTPEQAQPLVPPVTMNGRIQAPEDVDCYKIHAAAGEEIVFSVISARLEDKIHDLSPGSGGEHSDLILILSDPGGRELASNDDYYRADPMLAYRFDKAGDYILAVRDVRYGGQSTWTYHLTATRKPYVTALYPMAGRRGTNVAVQPVGYNLGGMGSATVAIPAAHDEGPMEVQLHEGGQATNPLPFLVSDLPEVLEKEPNDTPAGATRLPVPGGVSGRIGKAYDLDDFVFTAKRGVMYTFEVQARRYGSSLDSVLTLQDLKGKTLASNDDAPGIGKDSRLDWTAPADGDYILQVSDLNSRGGETYVYHLSAALAKPDFTLQSDDDKALVAPGSGYAMYVIASRRNGFAGDIHLSVEGLPPGVTATADRIPANMTQACVIFRGSADAKPGAGNIRLVGTATIDLPGGGKETVRRIAEPLEEIYMPGGGRSHFPVDMHTVSVTEPSDIVVKVNPARVSLTPGGSATIDVEVTRQNGYDKPVVLDVLLRHLGSVYGNPLPPGVTLDEAKSKTLLGPGESKGKIVLHAADDAAPVENLPIAVLGQVSINFVVKVSHAGEPVLLTVTKK